MRLSEILMKEKEVKIENMCFYLKILFSSVLGFALNVFILYILSIFAVEAGLLMLAPTVWQIIIVLLAFGVFKSSMMRTLNQTLEVYVAEKSYKEKLKKLEAEKEKIREGI